MRFLICLTLVRSFGQCFLLKKMAPEKNIKSLLHVLLQYILRFTRNLTYEDNVLNNDSLMFKYHFNGTLVIVEDFIYL